MHVSEPDQPIRYEVKSFRCHSIAEALSVITDDLGSDAFLMHSREVKTNFVGRLLGRPSIEVVGGIRKQTSNNG